MSIAEANKSVISNFDNADNNTVISEDNPKTIQVQMNSQVLYDERRRWKNFIIGTSAFFTFLQIPTLVSIISVLYYRYPLKYIYHKSSHLDSIYSILTYLAFFSILNAVSVVRDIPKKLKMGFMLAFVLCYWYLAGLFMRVSYKGDYEFYQYLVLIYTGLICSGIGLLVESIASYRRLDGGISIGVSAGLFALVLLFYRFLYTNESGNRLINPSIPGFIFYCVCSGVLALYLSMSLESMVTRRTEFYDYNDWFTGCVHLHTDIFYKFWVDLFTSPKEEIKTADSQIEEVRHREKTAMTEINL